METWVVVAVTLWVSYPLVAVYIHLLGLFRTEFPKCYLASLVFWPVVIGFMLMCMAHYTLMVLTDQTTILHSVLKQQWREFHGN